MFNWIKKWVTIYKINKVLKVKLKRWQIKIIFYAKNLEIPFDAPAEEMNLCYMLRDILHDPNKRLEQKDLKIYSRQYVYKYNDLRRKLRANGII